MSLVTFPKSVRNYLIAAVALLLAGCGGKGQVANDSPGKEADSITVSAAVSLKDAFTEIGEIFREKTGKAIHFNFGASGVLQQQIENGAPVDVFASAGEKQMDALADKQLIEPGTRSNFARNSLVLIVPQRSEIPVSSFADLTLPAVKKIAVGNPRTVPAGQYTNEALAKMGLSDKVASKLILAENVRQVLEYVIRGEVDAGIVYSTDAKQGGENVKIAATADEDTHSPILYPIASIAESTQKAAGRQFIDLVLSVEGQRILANHGFAITGPANSNQ